MKLSRLVAFVFAVATLSTLAVAGTANAGELPDLKLVAVPNTLNVGQATRLEVTGCPNRVGPGTYTEPGIVPSQVAFQPVDSNLTYWYADAKAGTKPGTYTLTAGCTGYSDVVTTTITITSRPYMEFDATPNPVVAGHPLRFQFNSCHSGVPPIKTDAVAGGVLRLSPGGGGTWMLDTTAGNEPGKYSLTAECPDEHSSASLELTVLAGGTSTPPTTPPQVPVVPSGAPETGGGALAAVVSAEPVV